MTSVVEELRLALGSEVVITGGAIAERATSYWDPSPTAAKALLKPRSTDEVSRALTICHKRRQPVVTHGGLTGCVEGAVSRPSEIILSLERMTGIGPVDTQGGTIAVEAGVVLEVLQNTVLAEELIFPLDLGARGSCTIGGNIATNAGGINVLRYGMMRNLVLGLEVVTADGTVISSMNQMLKNNAGFDNKQVFIGSEGTLGIVTRAVLQLFPRPTSCSTAMVAMNNFDQVIALLNKLKKELAGTLSAYEVMWGDYYRGVTGKDGHRAPMGRDHPFYVVLEAEGANATSDAERFEQTMEQAFESGVIVDAVIPRSEAKRRKLWDIREGFEPILPAILYDISLPIGSMAHYVKQVENGLKEKWPDSDCFVLGHIADGNLHLFVRPNVEGQLHSESDAIVYAPLEGLNGSVSAEHGIGTEKLDWLASSRSEADIDMMRLLKKTLDPYNLLNPGRVLKPHPENV